MRPDTGDSKRRSKEGTTHICEVQCFIFFLTPLFAFPILRRTRADFFTSTLTFKSTSGTFVPPSSKGPGIEECISSKGWLSSEKWFSAKPASHGSSERESPAVCANTSARREEMAAAPHTASACSASPSCVPTQHHPQQPGTLSASPLAILSQPAAQDPSSASFPSHSLPGTCVSLQTSALVRDSSTLGSLRQKWECSFCTFYTQRWCDEVRLPSALVC